MLRIAVRLTCNCQSLPLRLPFCHLTARLANLPDFREREFTDDDGTVYRWDSALRVFKPVAEVAPPAYTEEDMMFQRGIPLARCSSQYARPSARLNLSDGRECCAEGRRRPTARACLACDCSLCVGIEPLRSAIHPSEAWHAKGSGSGLGQPTFLRAPLCDKLGW